MKQKRTKSEDSKKPILGVGFDFLGYDEVFESVNRWRVDQEHHYACLSNADTVMMCQRDGELRRATLDASLVLPDGIGTILAATILGYKNRGRVTGPDLMLQMCDRGREWEFSHFFYGGIPGAADELAGKLSLSFPGLQVAGTCSPPFRPLSEDEDREIVQKINSTKPDILWVGLGAPKQEIWMASHVGQVQASIMFGVGAAFDFHSGRLRRAPKWMRRSGLEWVYRFLQEPRRLWRRTADKLLFPVYVVAGRLRRLSYFRRK